MNADNQLADWQVDYFSPPVAVEEISKRKGHRGKNRIKEKGKREEKGTEAQRHRGTEAQGEGGFQI